MMTDRRSSKSNKNNNPNTDAKAHTPLTQAPLTHVKVFMGAFPIMLANGLAPIVSLVDLWVVGNFIGAAALAAIALGVAIYGVFYWGFGFLRMSTAGLSAQANGAGNEHDVQAHLYRAAPMGLLIGIVLLALQGVLVAGLMQFFPAGEGVNEGAKTYLSARLYGLPATLGSLALMGWFIGLARPKRALYMQLVLNLLNVPLSLYFVVKLGWGLFGVGLASALAEWGGFAAGLFLARREILARGGWIKSALSSQSLLNRSALKRLGVANGDIFIRTMSMNIGFLFFARASAAQGQAFLAAYGVLSQFITMIALVLDGIAHVAEAFAGAAFGAKNLQRFDRAVRISFEVSFAFAGVCALLVWFGGPSLIDFITPELSVRQSARDYLPYCALVPLVGFAAWHLDGIYVGVTRTGAMRNGAVAAVLVYLALHFAIVPRLGGAGVWIAFLGYYLARAVTLLPAWPNIRRDMMPNK